VRMLRSITALSLVALYFLNISFLTLSGLCAMSEHSGQHQMLIRDHKVILHHSSGVTHEHHSFAAIFANSGDRDHEIAYSDLVNSSHNSDKKSYWLLVAQRLIKMTHLFRLKISLMRPDQ
jgi:hypothetical protein